MATNNNIDLNLNIKADAGVKSVRTMQLEVKELNKQLQILETEANKAMQMGDTDAMNKAKASHAERTKQLAVLKNDMKDVRVAQKYLDPGELLNGYVKLAQGTIAGFAAITSAMKLAGSENETINAIQEKGVQIIQLMMGLEQVRATFIDGAGKAQIKQLLETTSLELKKAFTIGVSTAAVEGQTVAVGGATVAQRIWNTTVAANPIVALVVAVAALAAGIYFLVEAQTDEVKLTKEQIKAREAEYERIKEANKQREEYDATVKSGIESASKEVSALYSLRYGSKEYKEELKRLTNEYSGYLTKAEQTKLKNAELTQTIDIMTQAVIRQAVAKAYEARITEASSQVALDTMNVEQKQLLFNAAERRKSRLADLQQIVKNYDGEIEAFKGTRNNLNTEWVELNNKRKSAQKDVEQIGADLFKTQQDLDAANNKLTQSTLKLQTSISMSTKYYTSEQITGAKAVAVVQKENINTLKESLEIQLKAAQSEGDYVNEAVINSKLIRLNNEEELKSLKDKHTKGVISQQDYDNAVINSNDKATNAQEANNKNLDAAIDANFEKKKENQKAIDYLNVNGYTKERNDITTHYDALIADAEKYGNSTVELKKSKAKELKAIDDKEIKENNDKLSEILQLQIDHETNIDNIADLKRKQFDIDMQNELIGVEEGSKKEEAIKQKYADKEKALNKEVFEQKVAMAQQAADFIMSSVSSLSESSKRNSDEEVRIAEETYNTKKEKEDSNYESSKKSLEDKLKYGVIVQSEYDNQLSQLESKHNDELEKLEKTKNDKIKKEKEKQWEIQHKIDIANAIVTGIQATFNAFKAGSALPGGPITGAIFAAVAAATSAVAIASIASQKMPKFAKGGMVYGNSHSAGGVQAELEGGEFIVNKKAMQNKGFANVVSAINSSTFSAPSFNNSSLSPTSNSAPVVASVDNEAIAAAVIAAIGAIPIYVTESDITAMQKKVSIIENNSKI